MSNGLNHFRTIYIIMNKKRGHRSIFNAVGGYLWIFPHLHHIPFLVVAVSECSLPSSTYLILIGYLNLATAAA